MKLASRFCWIAAVVLGITLTRTVTSMESESQAPFAFHNHIPSNCDNLFVVGDPLPAMRRMFESDTFHDFATDSRLAKKFMEIGTNFAQAEFMLDPYAKYVPSEFAIGFPSGTYAELEQLAKSFLAMELCSGAIEADGEAIANELPKAQAIFLKAAQTIKSPQCTVWLRFREEQIAIDVFDAIAAAAHSFSKDTEIPVDIGENTLHFDFLFVDLVSADVLPFFLAEIGLALDANEPILGEISDALAKFETEVHLELRGKGLCFQIGRRPQRELAYPVDQLGPLWSAEDQILVFGKWRIEELKRCNNAVAEIWQEWRDTASGKAARQADEEDLFGSMARFADQVERSADSATFHVTASDGLELTMQEIGFRPVQSLVDSPLVKFLPRDAEYADVDARSSLADFAADQLTDFEDRLGSQWFKAQSRGREDQVQQIDRITKFYYEQLVEFRRLAFDETKLVFKSPIATLVGSRGTIDRLEIRFDDAQGQENKMIISDAPMVEFATIGRLVDSTKPLRLPNEMVSAFLDAYVEDLPNDVLVPQDLGLGVETFALKSDVIDRILEGKVKVTIAGDLHPHYFVVDDWVVFSTSIRLSKSTLNAWKNPSQRFVLPQRRDGKLAAFGQLPGATFGAFIEYFAQLMSHAISGEGSVKIIGPSVQQFRAATSYRLEFVAGFGDACRFVDKVEWSTIDANNIRETRARVTFAKSSP